MTSRNTLGLLDARLLDLDNLAPQDAVEMLDRVLRLGRPGDTRITDHPDEAARIAQLCGGLPLALRIIAALLKENSHRPLAKMAADLEDERTRLDEFSYADTTVRAAFDLSYQRLDQERARLFRLLSVNPGPRTSTCAAGVLADVDQPTARRGLEALARAHLIDHDSNYGQWRMHDLLRLYAQQLSDAHADVDGRDQACDRLLRYYLDTANAANDHLQALPGSAVPTDFTDREGALAWLDAECPSLVAAITMAVETGQDQIAVRLPITLAQYFYGRRRFDDILATTMISRDAACRLGERGIEAVALNNHGAALAEMRRFEEAITAHQDAAAIFRETGDQFGEGNALCNLGAALTEVGRFEEAITADQDAAAIFREAGNRQREGMALDNLGIALEEVGRFEEAITVHQDAVTIGRETGDRYGQGMALCNLGMALKAAGRFEEAITAYQEDLAICREVGDRYGEATALDNLGTPLGKVGRFEEAITAHQDAAAIFRETGDRRSEGMALDNLGIALADAGRFEEAITAHQDAAAILREIGDRQREGMALDNLGIALREVGRFEEAITAHQDAAAIFREIGDRQREGEALEDLELDRAAEQA